jgi:hypothetical protein
MVELSPTATVKSSIPMDGNSRRHERVLWQAGILIRRKKSLQSWIAGYPEAG